MEHGGRVVNDTNGVPSTTNVGEEVLLSVHEALPTNPWTQRIQRILEYIDIAFPSWGGLLPVDSGTGGHDQAPHSVQLTAESLRHFANETRRQRTLTNDSTRAQLGSPRRRQIRVSQSEPAFGRTPPYVLNGWVPPWSLNENGPTRDRISPRELQNHRPQ